MQSLPPPKDCRNPNPNPNPVPHIPGSANAPPPAPPRGSHHRRTRSELPLRTSGDLSDNLRQFDEIGPDDDFLCTYMDMEKLGVPRPGPGSEPGPCWDWAGESSAGSAAKHRHSSSVDGSSMPSWVKGEGVFEEGLEIKKAMTSKQLAELAAIDPKRAKRILANRQSAAHSKERKARYISVLERNVQTLQTEATTLSAQLTLYQRDTTGLSAENADLNLQLQIMEQQAQLHDALNETLKHEVQRLKIATGEISNTSETYNMGLQHIAYNLSFPLPN